MHANRVLTDARHLDVSTVRLITSALLFCTATTLVAPGMGATVAVPKTINTARNVNVRTAHTLKRVIHALMTSRKAAALPSSRATASAMVSMHAIRSTGSVDAFGCVQTHCIFVDHLPVDNNNVGGCNWDGGDCCGDKANIKYCKRM